MDQVAADHVATDRVDRREVDRQEDRQEADQVAQVAMDHQTVTQADPTDLHPTRTTTPPIRLEVPCQQKQCSGN